MWIVRLALRRPYTFVVMAVLIAILGGVAIATLPVDIFPYIDIPVVSIVWQYNGLTPEEMESRIVTNFERALTSNVIGIEHIESQSHQSVSVVRVYFHPSVQVDLALSQIVRSEEHTSELQSLTNLVCRLLLEKKKKKGRPSRTSTSDKSSKPMQKT